nr:hypothetical protein [Tanacetum cinerariifolium]
MSGLEEPEQAPPSPDYIPGPEHADDEIVAEDQPYAEDASPIAQSPEYVPESDFEMHPEDDDDEDPEEDPVDYPADEEMTVMTRRSHQRMIRMMRMRIWMPRPMRKRSTQLLPTLPIRSLGYRAAMIRLRDEAVFTSSPPLQLPSTSRREDRPEVTLPPQKRLDIALGPRYEIGESSSAAAARPAGGFREDYGFVATVDREIMRDPEREIGYGITDSWDEIVETLQGTPVSTNTELGGYVREFETRVRQDTDEIYMRLDDEQTERQLLAGRLNIEAWVRATDASDLVHGEVMSLCTTMLGQMSEIRELQAADYRRQTVISELLRIDHRRSIEISKLRTALQGQ